MKKLFYLLMFVTIIFYQCSKKSESETTSPSYSKTSNQLAGDVQTEKLDEDTSGSKADKKEERKQSKEENSIETPLNPFSIASDSRLLEYKVYLDYKVSNLKEARIKIVDIIKKDSMDAWNQRLGTNYKWDTALLAHIIYEEGYEVLSEVDGSFACVLYAQDQGLYVFRNIIAPLFIDIHMNLSSTKFGKASLIEPHVVHKLKLNKKELTTTSIRFTTFDNPYYFV